MVFIAVHVVANQLQVKARTANFLQPQVERVVIRVPLIAFIYRVRFGFICSREGVNARIETREAKIEIVKTAARTVVLNVLPVKLVAGGVRAAVTFAAPERHIWCKIQVA